MQKPHKVLGKYMFVIGMMVYLLSVIAYAIDCGTIGHVGFFGLVVGAVVVIIGVILTASSANKRSWYGVIATILLSVGGLISFGIGVSNCFVF